MWSPLVAGWFYKALSCKGALPLRQVLQFFLPNAEGHPECTWVGTVDLFRPAGVVPTRIFMHTVPASYAPAPSHQCAFFTYTTSCLQPLLHTLWELN